MNLRVNHIIRNTKVEGPGNRCCIFLQGCLKHCYKCNSPQTWDLNAGKLWDVDLLASEILAMDDIEGVTFSGGEPLLQSKALYELSLILKKHDFSIVIFTGYSYDIIKKVNCASWNNLLSVCDLLISEPFVYNLKTTDMLWVGSSNQEYHFLSDRYLDIKKDLANLTNKIEIRLNKDGSILVNGMADNNKVLDLFRDIL